MKNIRLKLRQFLYVLLGINLSCVIAYAQTDEQSKGFSDDKAYNLIRALLKQRIYSDPLLKKEYMSGNVPKVESLPKMVLLGLPEGTIVTIVETYLTKKKDSSSSEEMIFYSIEEHRKILFPESGIMPTPLTLSSYIKYRLEIEHSHGVGITTDFISTAIKRATEVFR
jgi:hypothetical protein